MRQRTVPPSRPQRPAICRAVRRNKAPLPPGDIRLASSGVPERDFGDRGPLLLGTRVLGHPPPEPRVGGAGHHPPPAWFCARHGGALPAPSSPLRHRHSTSL